MKQVKGTSRFPGRLTPSTPKARKPEDIPLVGGKSELIHVSSCPASWYECIWHMCGACVYVHVAYILICVCVACVCDICIPMNGVCGCDICICVCNRLFSSQLQPSSLG